MNDYELAESLTDALVGDWDETGDPPDLKDALEADRALRRVQALDDELDAVEILYQAQLDRLQEWRTTQTDRIAARRQWFWRSVETWAKVNRTDRRKSFNLPSGTIKTTGVKGAWKVTDRAVFIAWAKANDARLLRETTTWEPDMATIQAEADAPRIKAAPGLTWVEARVTVTSS